MKAARVLFLDNRDSFVFNLVDDFARRGAETRTVRGEQRMDTWLAHLAEFRPDLVVLSPGPGRPEDAGVMVPWLLTDPEVPILGVCLGHQAIAVADGATLVLAPEPVHGRACPIQPTADPLFEGLPRPFAAARYHSLLVTSVPDVLEVIATTRHGDSELVMALRHRERPRIGFQFHPESILTPCGCDLLSRVLVEGRRTA